MNDTVLLYCRKDIKFVSEIEKEMKILIEAVNKVSMENLFPQFLKDVPFYQLCFLILNFVSFLPKRGLYIWIFS